MAVWGTSSVSRGARIQAAVSVLRMRGRKRLWIGLAVVAGCGLLLGWMLWRSRYGVVRLARLTIDRWRSPDVKQETRARRCPDAPWLLPTEGILGVLWNDTRVTPYGPNHAHSGLDLFGSGRENTVPVYAAADGLLNRLPGWKSAVAILHDDPLRPGQVVWTYYAHMASATGKSYISPAFPPGTAGKRVQAGELLGYQGVWSGHPLKPGWMHLHFSVVKAGPDGGILNETVVENTLDPSPYLGIIGNADAGQPNWQPVQCGVDAP